MQCTQTYNLITAGHMQKFTIFNDCYIIREILCVVQSCTRDTTGELWFETRIGRSMMYDIGCIHYKSVYTSLFGTQLCRTAKLTYLMIACMYYAPNNGFTANDASFCNNKVGQLRDTLQFHLIVYVIIKITRSSTTVPLYEFAAKLPKKEHNLGVKKLAVKIKCKQG